MKLEVIFIKKYGIYTLASIGGSEDGIDYAAASALSAAGKHASAYAITYNAQASAGKEINAVFATRKATNERGEEAEQFVMAGEEPVKEDFFLSKKDTEAEEKKKDLEWKYRDSSDVTVHMIKMSVY